MIMIKYQDYYYLLKTMTEISKNYTYRYYNFYNLKWVLDNI